MRRGTIRTRVPKADGGRWCPRTENHTLLLGLLCNSKNENPGLFVRDSPHTEDRARLCTNNLGGKCSGVGVDSISHLFQVPGTQNTALLSHHCWEIAHALCPNFSSSLPTVIPNPHGFQFQLRHQVTNQSLRLQLGHSIFPIPLLTPFFFLIKNYMCLSVQHNDLIYIYRHSETITSGRYLTYHLLTYLPILCVMRAPELYSFSKFTILDTIL